MKTTLIFPTYLHLSGFISVTANADMQIDPRARSLTAGFSERDILLAVERFGAELVNALPMA
jgi:hypothetical protein